MAHHFNLARNCSLLGFVFLLSFCNLARAAQIVWTNSSGGLWNTPANWNPNQVPGPSDTAVVTNGSITVTLNGGITVGGLTLGANGNCGCFHHSRDQRPVPHFEWTAGRRLVRPVYGG